MNIQIAIATSDPVLVERIPVLYMAMIKRRSQQRTAAAQQTGRFDPEIVPLPTTMLFIDRTAGTVSPRPIHAEQR
jgi:hypothetical protein